MSDPSSPQGPPVPGSQATGPQATGSQASSKDTAGNVEGAVPVVPIGALADATAATLKFKSCRWRRPPEDGPECCGHRDVLPIAGTSFNPDAWCPDCAFFKLRRTPKKRNPDEYRY